ncbi:MAG: hypothetical protein IBJ19_02650 [Gemmatimonadaceae bacterium]|nr:hypothetical protein [Gemmatimonadaceae bacterium]
MIKDHFKASVQYGDLKGTASADRADGSGPEEFLKQRGLLSTGEFIVGIDTWAGENPGRHQDPVTVNFLLTEGAYDSVSAKLAKSSSPLPVRRVAVDIGIAEFLGLFKRFSVCLSPNGMLTDRSYSYPD